MKKQHLALGVGVLLVLLVVGLLFPKFLEWFVGGAVLGGAGLAQAQRRRRQSDRDHHKAIADEERDVDALQDAAADATEAADSREDIDPQDGAEGLSEEDRRKRLDEVAGRLK